ncbi:MAG: DUF1592 domain-containing protein [Myxococcales bacterium]|nr:DUF1592 domain-containing protein [Myxococcales bacterium]
MTVFVGVGCTGSMDGPGGDKDGDTDGGIESRCDPLATPEGAPIPLRRLTATQVERTVEDVLGVAGDLQVSDERLATAFRSNVSSAVDTAAARAYLDFAEALVADLDGSSCTDGDCIEWLFGEVGPRLFRRPLTDEQRGIYLAVFQSAIEKKRSVDEGVRWTVSAFLQSPSFLYLDEVTDEDGYLDDYSIAARLALNLWGMNPDEALLAKAKAGELSTPEQVRAEAERLLADPRSADGVRDFVDQWLKLEGLHNPDSRPDLVDLGPEVLAAMRDEPVLIFRSVLDGGGGLSELLTTTRVPAETLLKETYGDDIVGEEDGSFELDPTLRSGILTAPGVMASLAHAETTSPTVRGHTVLGNVLCRPPPPPPAGLSVTLPEPKPGTTMRERLEAHFSDASCSSCHRSMDGVGFAFERFDWLGRSRENDNGLPIDTKSTFDLGDEEVTIDGAPELSMAMTASPVVAECVSRQWIRYSTGIQETAKASCLVETLAEELDGKGGLREMMLALVASDWFRRLPDPAEEP